MFLKNMCVKRARIRRSGSTIDTVTKSQSEHILGSHYKCFYLIRDRMVYVF